MGERNGLILLRQSFICHSCEKLLCLNKVLHVFLILTHCALVLRSHFTVDTPGITVLNVYMVIWLVMWRWGIICDYSCSSFDNLDEDGSTTCCELSLNRFYISCMSKVKDVSKYAKRWIKEKMGERQRVMYSDWMTKGPKTTWAGGGQALIFVF